MSYKIARGEFDTLGQQFNAYFLPNDKPSLIGGKEAALQAREERKELQKLRTQEQRVKGRIELLAQWEEQHEAI